MNDQGSGVRGQEVEGASRAAVQTPHASRFTPHGIRGFTLLEVLIAVAIMAGIVAAIYGTFFTAGRSVEQAEARRDATDLVRTLVSKMSSDIANAYVNPGMNAPAVTTIFYGKKVQPETGDEKNRYDELYLTALTNWRRPDSKETDLWEVGYYFKEKTDGSGYVMMRREKRELSKDSPALEGGVEYAMTDRVESLQLRYKSGTSWSDEWNNKSALPSAVEITLLLDDGSAYITQVEVGK